MTTTGTNDVQTFSRTSAPTLAEIIFDPSRLRPLVVVSPSRRGGDRPLIDPAELRTRVGEHARVAMLDDEAAVAR